MKDLHYGRAGFFLLGFWQQTCVQLVELAWVFLAVLGKSRYAADQIERDIQHVSDKLTITVFEHVIRGNGWQVPLEDVDQSALANVGFPACKFVQRLSANFRDLAGRFVVLHVNTPSGPLFARGAI